MLACCFGASIPALPAAATALPFSGRGEVSPPAFSARLQVASVLQASGFRSDVTVFRLNARPRRQTGSEAAFRRNTAERVYTIEAAHNPEVAGSNPAPATYKGPGNRAFLFASRWRCGTAQ